MIQILLRRHYSDVSISLISTPADLQALASKQPDLVFLGVKQIPTASGVVWVSDFLDEHNINYTGSTSAAIKLDYDKPGAKRVVVAAGLMTASSFVATAGQYSAETMPLPYPLFVKPPNGGGGKGIGSDSVARNFEQYEAKVAQLSKVFGTEVLVESYLPGREFSVALLEQPYGLVAMPIELITQPNAQGDRILGQTVKAADTEHTIAVVDLGLKTRINRMAKAAFIALGARDYGRIDIRLDEQGRPHFLEANLIPGLAHHDFISYFTAACEINQAMSYETMILSVVNASLSRTGIIGSTPQLDPQLLLA